MPVKNGFEASEAIRHIEKVNPLSRDTIQPSTAQNERIPIFAVSASLLESQREFIMR